MFDFTCPYMSFSFQSSSFGISCHSYSGSVVTSILPSYRAQLVEEILNDCLLTDDELAVEGAIESAIKVEGIVRSFNLHSGRVAANESRIVKALAGLPEQFYTDKGGGWTFLNLCNDAEGHQWAGHFTMESLCVLAIASGHGRWCLPRSMWSIMPGAMPYVRFDLRNIEVPTEKKED